MAQALVELLTELVAIDSTSTRSNLPVLDVLQPRLAGLGFSCERLAYRDEAGVEKANLVASFGEGPAELALVEAFAGGRMHHVGAIATTGRLNEPA